MTDPYDECNFDDSDDLEENDDDIALGSMLSGWDDDDNAEVRAAVAATSSAIEERDNAADSAPTTNAIGYLQSQSQQSSAGASRDGSTSGFLAQLAAEIASNSGNSSGILNIFGGGGMPPGLMGLNMQQAMNQSGNVTTPKQTSQEISQQPQNGGGGAVSLSTSAAGQQIPSMVPQAGPYLMNQQSGNSMNQQSQGAQNQASQSMLPPPGISMLPFMQQTTALPAQHTQQSVDPSTFLMHLQAVQQSQLFGGQQQANSQLPVSSSLPNVPSQKEQIPPGDQAMGPKPLERIPQHVESLPFPDPSTVSRVPTPNSSQNAAEPEAPPRKRQARKRPTGSEKSKATPVTTSEIPSPSQTGNSSRLNVISCSDTDGESGSNRLTNVGSRPRQQKRSAQGSTVQRSTQSVVTLAPFPSSAEPAQSKKDSKASKVPSGSGDSEGTETTEFSSTVDKAKANRVRNREHARNTRLRKKAYLEKLKLTVDELCRERDTLVSERASAASLLVSMHNTRTDVLRSFLALRSANEKRRELWSSILDESRFTCVMPVTPYRSFPASEVQVSKYQRTVLGIDGIMSDTASLHVLLNSLVDRSRFPHSSVKFQYTLVTEDAVVAGNQMMARWTMSTLNAVQCGARIEVKKSGMMCCKFNSAHKIVGLELMFDVMAFMLQLKQSTGSDAFTVVPNTVQTCQRAFDTPMVMTLAERPYTIVQVNKLWEDMSGFSAEDVVGKKSCRVLQGQDTTRNEVSGLMESVRYKRPASVSLTNYTSSGRRFRNYLTVYPLSTDSKITHYVGLTTHVEWIDKPAAVSSVHGATLLPVMTAPAVAIQCQQSLQETRRPTVEMSSSSTSETFPRSSSRGMEVQPQRVKYTDKSQAASPPKRSQPQLVMTNAASGQDCCTTGGTDTVSSLTSSVSSASSSLAEASMPLLSNTALQMFQNNQTIPGLQPQPVATPVVTTDGNTVASISSSNSSQGSISTGIFSHKAVKPRTQRNGRKRKSAAKD